jgi:hypothetical protein
LFKSLFRRLIHLPRRLIRESLAIIQLAQFFLRNHLGSKAVVEPRGPVVSLTTYDGRIKSVYLAIESIARGELRPSRLILWIDDEGLFNNLPATILRLKKRGLEVSPSKNYGPHTKYYPYLESQDEFNAPLVTADDDMIYPKYWLRKLADAFSENPEFVNCFWAHVVAMNEHGIGQSQGWIQCSTTEPRYRHVAAGVTGVIYPPAFLMKLKHAGAAFEECCPKADDLWLHVQALRSGYKIRPILPRLPYFSFRGIPGTQHTALCFYNVEGLGNDRQINATYNDADIELLRNDEIGSEVTIQAGR